MPILQENETPSTVLTTARQTLITTEADEPGGLASHVTHAYIDPHMRVTCSVTDC